MSNCKLADLVLSNDLVSLETFGKYYSQLTEREKIIVFQKPTVEAPELISKETYDNALRKYYLTKR